MTDHDAPQDQPEGCDDSEASDPTLRKIESLFKRLRGADRQIPSGPVAGQYNHVSQRFRLLRRWRSGGLGDVWLAHDQVFNRVVALKEIQPQFARHEASWSRFLREALITGQLEHPGIVPIYAVGQHENGQPFYAMRFVQGETLLDGIARFHAEPAKSPDRKLQLLKLVTRFIDVCNAIAYAHSRGVIHRDIKPSNIMLGEFGETLVVDWGLAKIYVRPSDPAEMSDRNRTTSGSESRGDTDDPSGAATQRRSTPPEPTQMGSAIGSPPYMSPEQAAGRLDELGPASDIYSLGVTLFEILTGQTPIGATPAGKPRETLPMEDLLQRIQEGSFPRPSALTPSVPHTLEVVCLKAMSLHPEDRYASAREFASDLEAWLAGGHRVKFAFGFFRSIHLVCLYFAAPLFIGCSLLSVGSLVIGKSPDDVNPHYWWPMFLISGLVTLSYWFGFWERLERYLNDREAATGVQLRLHGTMTVLNHVGTKAPREQQKGSLTAWGILAFLLPAVSVWFAGLVGLVNSWAPLVWFYFYYAWRQPAKAKTALRWLIPLAIMTLFLCVGVGVAHKELMKNPEDRWLQSASVVGTNLMMSAYLGAVPTTCFLYCSWTYYRKRRIGLIIACANLLLMVVVGGSELLSKSHEHRRYADVIRLLVLWGIVPIGVVFKYGRTQETKESVASIK